MLIHIKINSNKETSSTYFPHWMYYHLGNYNIILNVSSQKNKLNWKGKVSSGDMGLSLLTMTLVKYFIKHYTKESDEID